MTKMDQTVLENEELVEDIRCQLENQIKDGLVHVDLKTVLKVHETVFKSLTEL